MTWSRLSDRSGRLLITEAAAAVLRIHGTAYWMITMSYFDKETSNHSRLNGLGWARDAEAELLKRDFTLAQRKERLVVC